ncbi:uncharacterized protein LOC144626588 [Crassostrea virginica]
MHHIPRLSEAVYVGMCRFVGSPIEVRIRREVADTEEVVFRRVCIMSVFNRMDSGSHREGFRLPTSDRDTMFWPPDHKVICDLSQISLYRIPRHTMILMECEDLLPGFIKLKLMTPSGNQNVNSSLILSNNEIYISSFLYRANMLEFQQAVGGIARSSVQHGPCATFNHQGRENDFAYCFRSHHWPDIALPWIQRCQLKNWPPDYVLSSIIRDGCHVVPISSSPLNPRSGWEWRISFSRAEQQLVYSMNHCQFLCYGLLKIFLKEVINSTENESCLCSYFMKTLVFWVIQNDNHLTWVPDNLLVCFWTCFKLLISWVNRGECPNFFIPQNNMFRVKVVGQTQCALFDHLFGLYCKGISCLLLSPTIGKYLYMPIVDRTLTFRTNEGSIIHSCRLDMCLFDELASGENYATTFKEVNELFIYIEQIQTYRLSLFQTVTVQDFLCKLLKNFSWSLSGQITEELSNKKRAYMYDKSVQMMKRSTNIGCASDILYLAMLYFKNCQYEQSLRCLRRAQDKMSKPYIIYGRSVNEEVYRRAMAGVSLSDRMRKCHICSISLLKIYVYIDEFVPEQLANKADGIGSLLIPPLVMLHMLFVLNHHRLGDTVRSQQSLQDLHTLMLYDDGTYVPGELRDISWQILGICQQTCGDYMGALNSFQCSLKQYPFSAIQKATMFRIQGISDFLLQI